MSIGPQGSVYSSSGQGLITLTAGNHIGCHILRTQRQVRLPPIYAPANITFANTDSFLKIQDSPNVTIESANFSAGISPSLGAILVALQNSTLHIGSLEITPTTISYAAAAIMELINSNIIANSLSTFRLHIDETSSVQATSLSTTLPGTTQSCPEINTCGLHNGYSSLQIDGGTVTADTVYASAPCSGSPIFMANGAQLTATSSVAASGYLWDIYVHNSTINAPNILGLSGRWASIVVNGGSISGLNGGNAVVSYNNYSCSTYTKNGGKINNQDGNCSYSQFTYRNQCKTDYYCKNLSTNYCPDFFY